VSFDTDSGPRDHDFTSGGGGGDDLTSVISGRQSRDPGLGLLLELAKRGEYDPWDIDIVALTDRYLAALDEHLDARDLGHVARLIFYAAALVHLKAQALAEREARIRREESFDATLDAQMSELADQLRYGRGLLPGDQPLVYPDFLADGSHDGGVAGLMPRERRPRERGLTLVDLIAALRSYDERIAQREAELANQETYDELALHEECVGTSHQDDLDRDIVGVRQDLWAKLDHEDAQVRLEDLLGPERTKAGAYLALLFLAQDEEVVLDQKTCYGELRIGRGKHFGEIRAGVRTEDSVEDAPVDDAPIDESTDESEDDEELCEVSDGEEVVS
jgi:segregation and condensation protein A